jgi:hypothetical protein
MSITSASYYIGELTVPNVGVTSSSIGGGTENFQTFIDQFEEEALVFALGQKLYNNFIGNTDGNGIVNPGANQKWFDLMDGATYTKSGVEYFWKGIKYQIGNRNFSLLAYYVYHRYINEQQSYLSDVGNVAPDAANAFKTSAINRSVKAYQKFINLYGNEHHYHNRNFYYNNGVLIKDYCGTYNNTGNVSLYHFLLHNEENYDDWRFTRLENKNSFGI